MCPRWFRFLCRTDARYFWSNRKMERPNWRHQDVFVMSRCSEARRRSDWMRLDNLPRIFVVIYSSRDPVRLGDKEHQARRFHGPDLICMSMFNDIEWKRMMRIVFRMTKKSGITQQKFLQGHWTFLGPGSEEKWHGSSSHPQKKKGDGIAQPTRWHSDSKKLVILSSKAPVCWIVGSWSKRKVHVPLTSMKILQIQNSCSKQYGAVANWYHQFALKKKKKDKSVFLWTLRFWPRCNGKKWKCWCLFWCRHLETGCKETHSASKHWQRTYRSHNCVKKFSQHLVIAGKKYKIRPNADDGWGENAPLCWEYSSSRSCPKTQAIGPVSEVRVVKIIDKYGIEVAIHSIANPEHTTYVAISTEEERFLNEIHDRKEELRSRIRKKWRKKSNQMPQGNLGISKHDGNLWRPYHPYSKSITIHKKIHSYGWEKVESYSCSFTRWRRFGSVSFQDDRNISTFWPRETGST